MSSSSISSHTFAPLACFPTIASASSPAFDKAAYSSRCQTHGASIPSYKADAYAPAFAAATISALASCASDSPYAVSSYAVSCFCNILCDIATYYSRISRAENSSAKGAASGSIATSAKSSDIAQTTLAPIPTTPFSIADSYSKWNLRANAKGESNAYVPATSTISSLTASAALATLAKTAGAKASFGDVSADIIFILAGKSH